MSTTAKVLTFIFLGIAILVVTTIAGAVICVFATPLGPTNQREFGGILPDLLEHLIQYGLKGGAIGAVIGGLTWAVWGYFWFRKKTDEATAVTNCNAKQPPSSDEPEDGP